MNHDRSYKTHESTEDPKHASQVRNEERDGGEDGLADHGNCCLRGGHEHCFGLAETVTGDDERVEVCYASVGDCVAEDTEPDAVALWIAEGFEDL